MEEIRLALQNLENSLQEVNQDKNASVVIHEAIVQLEDNVKELQNAEESFSSSEYIDFLNLFNQLASISCQTPLLQEIEPEKIRETLMIEAKKGKQCPPEKQCPTDGEEKLINLFVDSISHKRK